jgi:hypothetical protein
MTRFARALMASTIATPLLVIAGILLCFKGEHWSGLSLVIIGGIPMLLTWLAMRDLSGRLARTQIQTIKVEEGDWKLLLGAAAHFMPLMSLFLQQPLGLVVGASIVLLLGILFCASNAPLHNPMLLLLGYHFYKIELNGELPKLLMSRRSLRKNNYALTVVYMTDNSLLEIATAEKGE